MYNLEDSMVELRVCLIVTIFAIYCHMIFATLATLAFVEFLKLLATLWLA